MMDCMFLHWITVSFLNLAPIILPFPVDINHVNYYINIVEIMFSYQNPDTEPQTVHAERKQYTWLV